MYDHDYSIERFVDHHEIKSFYKYARYILDLYKNCKRHSRDQNMINDVFVSPILIYIYTRS